LKKSIVLLITLALIVAISSFIYVGFELLDQSSKNTQKKRALIQNTLFFTQLVEILKQKGSDINSSQGMETLILLPIELKSKEVKIYVEFDSAAKGINPNNFLKKMEKKSVIDPNYVLLFDRILQTYNVQNKDLFIAMIEDTLDKDLDERLPGSELALYNKRFAQGSIENKKKFQLLIDSYIQMTEDGNIKKVPWDELLSFYAKQVDINYISPKLLRFILPYLDEEAIRKLTSERDRVYEKIDDMRLAKEDLDELKKYDVSSFVPVVFGELEMKLSDRTAFVRFVYDIKQKKVLDIEEKIF